MCSGIPVRTSWVRLWRDIMEDISAMALLWKKVSTMICSLKKGKSKKLHNIFRLAWFLYNDLAYAKSEVM